MRRMLIWIVLAGCAAAAAGERAGPDPFKELDAKLAGSLERDKFSQASRDFVQALWGEYKTAWRKNEQKMDWRGAGGKAAPRIRSYQEYVGKYSRGARPILEVATDPAGRFLAKLEGHTIPAIATNRSILFTSGDVVYAPTLPRLGPKPHAVLEFFTLTRQQDRYVFTSPGAPLSRAVPVETLP